LKRGEIWTAAGTEAYAAKPRPVVILQDDRFAFLGSVTVCPFTSNPLPAAYRVAVDPSEANGLHHRSSAMADKLMSLPRARLRDRLGRVNAADMVAINRAVLVFLGSAGGDSR